jgi:hypothetical protein
MTPVLTNDIRTRQAWWRTSIILKKRITSFPEQPRLHRETVSKREERLGTVAHTCNPSYSGGRDQEDHGSKPAWVNSSQDPILKNPSQK